jgi:hypothetical protein
VNQGRHTSKRPTDENDLLLVPGSPIYLSVQVSYGRLAIWLLSP